MLHRDDPDVPVGPIVEALNEHVRAGRIRAFGGSNWSVERIQEANKFAQAQGLVPFTVSSPQFSLAEQMEAPWTGCVSIGGKQGRSARSWYEQSQIALFTWSSLASGFFSGRYVRANGKDGDAPIDDLCMRCYGYEENFTRLDRAATLAEKRGATLPEIALAYVLCQPANIFPLVGCQTREEFEVNAAALEIDLTPQELAWLDLAADHPE